MFYQDAEKIFRKIIDNRFRAFISAGIATDIFYILQKNDGKEKALQFIKELVTIVKIAAVQNQVEIIVTRNTNDFKPVKKDENSKPERFSQNYIIASYAPMRADTSNSKIIYHKSHIK